MKKRTLSTTIILHLQTMLQHNLSSSQGDPWKYLKKVRKLWDLTPSFHFESPGDSTETWQKPIKILTL